MDRDDIEGCRLGRRRLDQSNNVCVAVEKGSPKISLQRLDAGADARLAGAEC